MECSDDEEDAEEENFFRREEISQGAVADGKSHGWYSSRFHIPTPPDPNPLILTASYVTV